MATWNISNGVLVLEKDGEDCFPTAEQLFQQRGKATFVYEGVFYPSLEAELNIRISKIGLQVCPKFHFAGNNIKLSLYAIKRGCEFIVAAIRDKFLDYVIVNNTIHFLSGDFASISEVIAKSNVNIPELSFSDYLKVKRGFIDEGVNYVDDVEKEISSIKEDKKPYVISGLKATLFPYQESGCNWLSFMVNNHCGCILGDEMGLGKTLQIIALFGRFREATNSNPHFLVICPVSLLENWKREIAKFYPSLSVLVHHGCYRTGNFRDLLKFDVVVMSYSNVQTDLSMLSMIKWNVVAIDEAQNIKNPSAKRTKNIKLLKRDVSIAVTGTPFENHMTDVWSIVDFILPEFLGSLSQFENTFPDTRESAVKLEKYISPIMIRRRVCEVAKDLPERVDIPTPIRMTEEEARYYENERKNEYDRLAAMQEFSLYTIQKLRQYCTHPLVYNKELDLADPASVSTKYQRFCEILEEVFLKREKAIVFTSFTEMSNIIIKDISKRFSVYVNAINGSVEVDKRQKIIDEFSAIAGGALLVLNPKAAGSGLNITAANHVIHYNLEWNPAIEDQASARAYRRGQNKTVFVHRLYYTGTVEEIINEKIQNKRLLSDTAIIGNAGAICKEDLVKVLGNSPYIE